METFFLILALLVFLVTVASATDLFFGIRGMARLRNTTPAGMDNMPLVSLIVPACNEEKNIARAVHSFFEQSYGNLEIIVVNDRSTDSTAAILENLQLRYDGLKLLHIDVLPDGWMGKANALQQGVQAAAGSILLFSDADILMEKSTIARAVGRLLEKNLDHLCLIFRNTSPGWLLNSLILDAGAGLLQLFRPWRANKKRSRSFIGVGAFNMVRKNVYEKIGGHAGIKMHPIDDIMLGKSIKRQGYSQECLLGTDLVSVPWYDTIAAMVNGLMKNALAVINFRYSLLLPLIVSMFILNILPLWALLLVDGYARLIFLAALLVKIAVFQTGARLLQQSALCSLGVLITPYISMYIIFRAAWLNYRDNGIYWRGTHYSLAALRKNPPILP